MQVDHSILQVRVPASSANLGAGFDVLGLALDLWNSFDIVPEETTRVEAHGHAEGLPLDESNLFYRAFSHLYSVVGRVAPPALVRMKLDVTPGRGLGSSATAVVGGLVAANTMLGTLFSREELLPEAVKLEHGRHADNVAPALLGGLVVNVLDNERVISLNLPFPKELKAVLFIPSFGMDTTKGRALMPERYSRGDVVFNLSRAALLVAAITQRRYSLLSTAMEDRLHQPYRATRFPAFRYLITAALESGAHGACLSGGGSSVLALTSEHEDDVAKGFSRTAEQLGVEGAVMVLGISENGAQASWTERA